MRINKLIVGTFVALFLTLGVVVVFPHAGDFAQTAQAAGTVSVAVAPQPDATHVYVAPKDLDRFVTSLITTFGGTATKQGVFTVTPTQSSTMSQLVLTLSSTPCTFGIELRLIHLNAHPKTEPLQEA
jgi:hypothetical protein